MTGAKGETGARGACSCGHAFWDGRGANPHLAPCPLSDVPCSAELRDEQFWRDGAGFRWMFPPRFNVYVPADKRPRALLNRYPHNVIGAAVVLFGRCWGVQWRGTDRVRGPLARWLANR